MAIETKAGAATVRVVVPEILPEVASIVVAPVATEVARPAVFIFATETVEELQVTEVKVFVLPSEYLPVAVNCSVSPSGIDGVAGVTEIEVSAGAAPVPVRPAEIGLPNAPKGMASDPVSAPCAKGSKVTPMVQVPPALTVAHVLLPTAKSPVTVGVETVSAAVRLFVNVIVLDELVVPEA
jgi:hypothetical protein